VWADTLLSAERQHLLRLLFWAGLSIIAATLVAVMLAARSVRSPLLQQFAIQMAAWGILIGAVAALCWNGMHLRDVAGAARLERMAWLNIGLNVGLVGIGVVLALTGRALGRRMSLVGAGVGIVVQGLALLLLDLQFAAVVSR
jgi:hypothetical protein